MSKKVTIPYECNDDSSIIQFSLFLEKGLWSLTEIEHVGEDLICTDCKPESECSDKQFKSPIRQVNLGKASDAIDFDTRIDTLIAAGKDVEEVKVKVELEGGKKKKTKTISLPKEAGKSAHLQLTIEYISVILLLFVSSISFGQQTNKGQNQVTWEVDNLRPPSNAAANLLGIEESSIKLIENPTDFSALLRTSTQNFSALPTDFAFQINPFGTFQRTPKPLDTYISNDFANNLATTALASFAFVDREEQGIYQGLGFEFSISKGKVKNEQELLTSEKKIYKNLQSAFALDRAQKDIDSLRKEKLLKIGELKMRKSEDENLQREVIDRYRSEIRDLGDQVDVLQEEFFGTQESLNYQKLADEFAQKIVEENNNRSGLRVDFSGAMVLHFPERSFGYSKVEKAGLWLTASPNASKIKTNGKEKNQDWFSILRYQKQPNLLVASGVTEDASMIDFGTKYLYRLGKLQLSGEGIYRRFGELENDEIDQNSFRYLIDANYKLPNETYLSFSYGKDFNEQTIQNGNVIAAFNFIKGLGKKRDVKLENH